MSDEQEPEAAGKPPENFLPLSVLIEACLSQARETFVESRPNALLLVDNPGHDVENASFQTLAAGSRTGADAIHDRVLQRLGSARFVCVLKRPENKFAAMLTLGRAANNEIRLNVPSVSKFHAYFTHVAREGCWYLADANSSNGTFLDGKELPPSHGKVKLLDGAMLRFGPDVTAQFFTAAGLWERVNSQDTQSSSGRATVKLNASDVDQRPEGKG